MKPIVVTYRICKNGIAGMFDLEVEDERDGLRVTTYHSLAAAMEALQKTVVSDSWRLRDA